MSLQLNLSDFDFELIKLHLKMECCPQGKLLLDWLELHENSILIEGQAKQYTGIIPSRNLSPQGIIETLQS